MGKSAKNMNKRERRDAKKKEREQKNITEREARLRRQRMKSGLTWTAVLIVVLFIGYWAYGNLSQDKGALFPYGSVHWHSSVDIIVCGESKGIEYLGSGNQHVGGLFSHTHGDGKIHMEGSPRYMSQIALGGFFKAVNIPFSNEGVWDFTNGDSCPDGSVGTLQVSVNGEEIQDPVSYVPMDGDAIRILFG